MRGVRSLALVQKFRQGAWIWRRWKLDGEFGGNGLDAVPAFRSPHYTTNGQRTFFLEVLSHGHIGSDHETFNDVLGDSVLPDRKSFYLAILDDRRGFDGAKCECAMLLANAAQ